jgi:hypothetical protein
MLTSRTLIAALRALLDVMADVVGWRALGQSLLFHRFSFRYRFSSAAMRA